MRLGEELKKPLEQGEKLAEIMYFQAGPQLILISYSCNKCHSPIKWSRNHRKVQAACLSSSEVFTSRVPIIILARLVVVSYESEWL